MSFLSQMFGGGGGGAGRVNGAEARKLVAGGALLLDVRTVPEYQEGHIGGSTNIPLHVLPARMNEIKPDQVVVVYCRSGARSAQAARLLQQHGIQQVHDLGSISAW